jgi:hypothetical protein
MGALAAEADGVCSLAGAFSTVPVISTLWPTCSLSFASLASSLYSLAMDVAGAEAEPDVPVAPGVELVLNAAFVRMNFGWVEDMAPVVPLVPVGDCSARATQPVTVSDFDESLCEADDAGDCAKTAVMAPATIAAHAADQIFVFIVPPSCLVLEGRPMQQRDRIAVEQARGVFSQIAAISASCLQRQRWCRSSWKPSRAGAV